MLRGGRSFGCGTVNGRLSCSGPGELVRGFETVFWYLSVQTGFLTCVVALNDSASVEYRDPCYGWFACP